MGKGTHFLGQPILNQLLNYFNKQNILQISRESGGERYVKTFNAWCHLTVMLYAVIMRFDSLREITSATMMEWRKLAHLGIKELPRRSTLSDANALRDVLMGMIPFFVGDVIDFFHRANIQNMQMIQGFVDGDETIIKQVNQRAWQSAIVLIVLLLLIALMIWALVSFGSYLYSLVASIF